MTHKLHFAEAYTLLVREGIKGSNLEDFPYNNN